MYHLYRRWGFSRFSHTAIGRSNWLSEDAWSSGLSVGAGSTSLSRQDNDKNMCEASASSFSSMMHNTFKVFVFMHTFCWISKNYTLTNNGGGCNHLCTHGGRSPNLCSLDPQPGKNLVRGIWGKEITPCQQPLKVPPHVAVRKLIPLQRVSLCKEFLGVGGQV